MSNTSPRGPQAPDVSESERCEFCTVLTNATSFLCENKTAVAFFDRFPVNPGHTLIVPRRHIATVFDLNDEEWLGIRELLQETKQLIDTQFDADGYNVGVNCGTAAGQTIFHLHVHVIPRYLGDVDDPRGGIRNIKAALVPYP